MGAMRRLAIISLLPLLLTGCVGAESYDEHVTYRVGEIATNVGITWARLSIHGAAAGEPIQPIDHVSVEADTLPPGVGVGDLLVCRVRQHRQNLADSNVEQTVDDCRPG